MVVRGGGVTLTAPPPFLDQATGNICKDDVNGLFSISDIFLHGLNIQADIRRVYCPRNEEFSTIFLFKEDGFSFLTED